MKFKCLVTDTGANIAEIEAILKGANIAFEREPDLCTTDRGGEYLGEIVTFITDDYEIIDKVVVTANGFKDCEAFDEERERRKFKAIYFPKSTPDVIPIPF